MKDTFELMKRTEYDKEIDLYFKNLKNNKHQENNKRELEILKNLKKYKEIQMEFSKYKDDAIFFRLGNPEELKEVINKKREEDIYWNTIIKKLGEQPYEQITYSKLSDILQYNESTIAKSLKGKGKNERNSLTWKNLKTWNEDILKQFNDLIGLDRYIAIIKKEGMLKYLKYNKCANEEIEDIFRKIQGDVFNSWDNYDKIYEEQKTLNKQFNHLYKQTQSNESYIKKSAINSIVLMNLPEEIVTFLSKLQNQKVNKETFNELLNTQNLKVADLEIKASKYYKVLSWLFLLSYEVGGDKERDLIVNAYSDKYIFNMWNNARLNIKKYTEIEYKEIISISKKFLNSKTEIEILRKYLMISDDERKVLMKFV